MLLRCNVNISWDNGLEPMSPWLTVIDAYMHPPISVSERFNRICCSRLEVEIAKARSDHFSLRRNIRLIYIHIYAYQFYSVEV